MIDDNDDEGQETQIYCVIFVVSINDLLLHMIFKYIATSVINKTVLTLD